VLVGAVVVLLVGAVVHGTAGGLGVGAAYLLPPLLLLLALAMRRYPGEQALLALMSQGDRRGGRDRVDGATPKPRPRALVPRGGGLIASSLAVRPPPVPAVVSLS
jgi:hypothetical protein